MASPSAHTQAPLSLETSLSIPSPRTSWHSALSSSSSSPSALACPSSSPSPFLLTLQIVRLVDRFRKRAKTRVHTRNSKKVTSAELRQDFCQEVERQAFEEIDRYLGRKTAHPHRKGRKGSGEGLPSPAALVTECPPVSPKSIDWLVHELNLSVTSEDHSLSTVAKSGDLFLNRKVDFHIQRLSLRELAGLFMIVKDLLDTLRRGSPPHRGARTVCEGNEILDLSLDETYFANLEHLLLCLQDQLIRILVSHCIGLVHRHVLECQKDQHQHCKEWFFEFPDARHPLSTTWPWSIKPSLAVIWGVCWMFYDNTNFFPPFTFDAHGNMVDVISGNILVPGHAVEQYRFAMQQQLRNSYTPATNNSQSGQTLRGQIRHPQPPITNFEAQPRLPANSAPMPQPPNTHNHPFATSHSRSPSSQGRAGDLVTLAGTNITYSAAPPAWPVSTSAEWLPQENFSLAPGLGFNPDNTHAADDSGLWAHLPPHSSTPTGQQPDFDFEQPLPPRSRHPVTPTIRLTTDFSGFPSGLQQTPQDASYYSASTNSSVPLQEDTYNNPYSAHLSPQDIRYMPHSAQDNMNAAPVSPVSAHSPRDNATLPELLSRKRSHSVMRGEPDALPPPQTGHYSRAASVASQAPNSASPAGEDYSPRGSRSFKRGDPPINTDNKYICDFAPECAGQTFDRKCEWSKHMDKHDRPYRCSHQACAKLQGFTYSGGLLRHEREVHGKHGGPKAQLMCPFEDCKRHVGKGFTRKENLNEHIRRVHENKTLGSQPLELQETSQFDYKPELQETVAGADPLVEPPPVARMYNDVEVDEPFLEPSLGKRKRDEVERSPSVDVEDLKQEVKRLREDNASKDERLRKMEAAEAMREVQMQHLQQAVSGLQQSQQVGMIGQDEQIAQELQGQV